MRQASALKSLAPLAFLAALMLPQVHAQSIYGSWTGLETVQAESLLNGQSTRFSTTYVYPATLGISYDASDFNLAISIGSYSLTSYLSSATFGPQGGNGTVEVPTGHYGFEIGNFFATYAGIFPYGTIDTSTGNAVADVELINVDPFGTGEIDHVSFNSAGTLPEPTSIVLAAPAFAALVLAAALRRQRTV